MCRTPEEAAAVFLQDGVQKRDMRRLRELFETFPVKDYITVDLTPNIAARAIQIKINCNFNVTQELWEQLGRQVGYDK